MTYSGQVVIDADITEHGWEVTLRYSPEDAISAWSGLAGDLELTAIAHSIGNAVVKALIADKNEQVKDLHGTLNPNFNENTHRFKMYVKYPDLEEEPGWAYKLEVIDTKYLDSDGHPVSSIAGGDNYNQAFKRASEMVEEARNADHCIF